MKRRKFLTLLGGAATAWPLAARAQQQAMPVVGYLSTTSASADTERLAEFREGLKETGYVEGRNVAIEYRWAEGQLYRLPEQAADLVRRQVAVIAAGPAPAALAAKAATASIPVIFGLGNDPVKLGLVTSFNRPTGNVTGVSWQGNILGAKQFQLLHDLVSKTGSFGFLVSANAPDAESDVKEVQAAANRLGQKLLVVKAGQREDIDGAFAEIVAQHGEALSIEPDGFFTLHLSRIVDLAARYRLPTIYPQREYVSAGGLISYGASRPDAYRQVGIYAGRVLKGEKPGDLPVVQPTRFDVVINLKTAKTLGLDVPPSFLALADEVIE